MKQMNNTKGVETLALQTLTWFGLDKTATGPYLTKTTRKINFPETILTKKNPKASKREKTARLREKVAQVTKREP